MKYQDNNQIFSGTAQATLRKKIMRRVYALWLIRRLLSPMTAKIILFVALTKQLFIFVSVRNVILNSPPMYDVAGSTQFFGTAFMNTGTVVQASLIGILALSFWLARDFIKGDRILARGTTFP